MHSIAIHNCSIAHSHSHTHKNTHLNSHIHTQTITRSFIHTHKITLYTFTKQRAPMVTTGKANIAQSEDEQKTTTTTRYTQPKASYAPVSDKKNNNKIHAPLNRWPVLKRIRLYVRNERTLPFSFLRVRSYLNHGYKRPSTAATKSLLLATRAEQDLSRLL